jgi:molecular chaperone DnaK
VSSAFDKLNESQQKIGEALYAQSQTAEATAAESETGEPASPDDEDIVDAEVVEDEPEGGTK